MDRRKAPERCRSARLSEGAGGAPGTSSRRIRVQRQTARLRKTAPRIKPLTIRGTRGIRHVSEAIRRGVGDDRVRPPAARPAKSAASKAWAISLPSTAPRGGSGSARLIRHPRDEDVLGAQPLQVLYDTQFITATAVSRGDGERKSSGPPQTTKPTQSCSETPSPSEYLF